MTVHRHGYRVIAGLAAVFLLGVSQTGAAQEPPVAAEDAVRGFVARVEAYARLHQRLEAPLPPIGTTADRLSRLVNRRYLASAIRSARRDAKRGDIFTSDVADVLRLRLTEGLTAAERAALISSPGGEADVAGTAVVYEPFREEESCGVPLRLLEQLPPLPGDIQYRILGSSLVLWDLHADIVIDVLPDAFRAPFHVSSR
jgi:hypothetical protein